MIKRSLSSHVQLFEAFWNGSFRTGSLPPFLAPPLLYRINAGETQHLSWMGSIRDNDGGHNSKMENMGYVFSTAFDNEIMSFRIKDHSWVKPVDFSMKNLRSVSSAWWVVIATYIFRWLLCASTFFFRNPSSKDMQSIIRSPPWRSHACDKIAPYHMWSYGTG